MRHIVREGMDSTPSRYEHSMPHRRAQRKGHGVAPGAFLDTLAWKGGRPVLKDWTRMFRPNWEAIALDPTLGKTELRVLLLTVAVALPDQRIPLSQKEMGRKLDLPSSVISRAVRHLVAQGYLFQDGHRLTLNSRVAAMEPKVPAIVKLRRREIPALEALDAGLCRVHEEPVAYDPE